MEIKKMLEDQGRKIDDFGLPKIEETDLLEK
jgi:hypothetical protein